MLYPALLLLLLHLSMSSKDSNEWMVKFHLKLTLKHLPIFVFF